MDGQELRRSQEPSRQPCVSVDGQTEEAWPKVARQRHGSTRACRHRDDRHPNPQDGPQVTVTTDEAALMVGVKPATIRQWVKRGYIKPIYPSWAGVVKFHEQDVTECHRLRRSKPAEARFQQMVTRWQAESLALLDKNCHTRC